MTWSMRRIATRQVTPMLEMLAYDFMRNAFAASAIVAVLAGVVGFFLVLREQTFAGHALSHVSFAGATGAVLIGIPPFAGILVLATLVGIGMGALGEKLRQRDVAIGIVLAFSLGLGMLFLHFYTHFATQATALLFGNVLGIDRTTIGALAALACVSLAALSVIARPLLFASLHPELAEAKAVPVRLVSILFLVLVALAVAEATQIVGVLLVFALMVASPAAAQLLSARFWRALSLSVIFALLNAWGGIALAYITDWPSSFWITALGTGFYLAALIMRGNIRTRRTA